MDNSGLINDIMQMNFDNIICDRNVNSSNFLKSDYD